MKTDLEQQKSLPLTIHELNMFIPLRINNSDSFAQLDTGSNKVLIQKELVKDLPIIGNSIIETAFNKQSYSIIDNIKIEFFNNIYSKKAVAMDLVFSSLPFKAEMILDAGTIFEKPIIFDFNLHQIVNYNEVTIDKNKWVELETLSSFDYCIFKAKVDNDIINLFFDTGAAVSLINVNSKLNNSTKLKKSSQLNVSDSSGKETVQQMYACTGINIEKVILPSFDCFVLDLQSIENKMNQKIDIVFGANAMIKSGLRWLFADKKLYFSV